MKLFITFSLLVLSTVVLAEGDAKFTEQKTKMLEGITKQIEALQTTKSCVDGATDLPAIKKCHEIAKGERMKMKSERIDKKIKKLEDEKKNVEEKKN